jgi:tRNA threonylcarbamoyladenosine biosynthesis protein TsaB
MMARRPPGGVAGRRPTLERMPVLLALDTSTDALAVALWADGALSTLDEQGGARASVRIVPAAMQLLSDAGVRPADLDAVAFGRGPGAFTGLRTACAVAQGLAFGASKPVLAIDSLQIVAEDARDQLGGEAGFECWVAMDARMAEVYAAAYAWDGRRWAVRDAPALYALDALQARWDASPPRVVAGSAPAAYGDRLHAGAARVVPQARHRAAALARVARLAWDAGEAIDAALALPLYLRDKVALTEAERGVAR